VANTFSAKKKKTEQHKKAKNWAKEWLDALIFAAVAAMIIRTFIFEAYRIPTPSMENSLMTGDFLIVSKMSYGARTPMSIGVPFTQIHIPGVKLPWFRLPGFSEVERNDIVVFNYPIDDVVISQKTNYVKRCVAIAGDSVKLESSRLYINGELSEQFPTIRRFYEVRVRERIRLSPSKVRATGAEIKGMQSETSYVVNMSEEEAEVLRSWPEVEEVIRYVLPADYNEVQGTNFTFARGFASNHHNMDTFIVPYAGMQINLTRENWHMYKDIVEKYEENEVQMSSAGFMINGENTNSYTIKQNYYFMMGDNRDDSEDSRFWGFVPHDHVVGSPFMIYFSWDKENIRPRFGRIFDLID
jgi:signal peptidase I